MTITNDPNRAGQHATQPEYCGEHKRYSVFAVHTRFDTVCWFVTDALGITDAEVKAGKFPPVIRQEKTREEAMRGLA
ncbi:MAG: hypothetical protein MOB07_31135 [Acidobacteria bacterium]|nr:hypothetical protein [Acidobacteriota bacterium]